MATLSSSPHGRNGRTAHLLARYDLGNPLNHSSSKSSNIRRVQKPVRIRTPRNCHQCNIAFGPSRICLACGHQRCQKCPQIRRLQPRRASDHPSPRQRREPYTDEGSSNPITTHQYSAVARRVDPLEEPSAADNLGGGMSVNSDQAHEPLPSSMSIRDCLGRRPSMRHATEGYMSSAEVSIEARSFNNQISINRTLADQENIRAVTRKLADTALSLPNDGVT